jgi:hypothetical protein
MNTSRDKSEWTDALRKKWINATREKVSELENTIKSSREKIKSRKINVNIRHV